MAMLLIFIIILPSVALSLFYISSLLNSLTEITDTDVRIGRVATDLSLTMLETRRIERNYRLFGNPTEIEEIEAHIARADSLLKTTGLTAQTVYTAVLKDLSSYLDIYNNSFATLVEHVSLNPPEQRITALSRNLTEFQETYRQILKELENTTGAERDSIITLQIASLDEQTLNVLSMTESQNDPVNILENLEQSRQSFLERAHELATMSWDNMQMHKLESQMIEARAKRNIITVLIVSILAGIMMLMFMPRYIMRPLNSLNRILQKAREGDLSGYAIVQSHDEIGDLAFNYNQMIERMRYIDGLKTRKIASQKRVFDRLIEQIELPICILTIDMKAIFYNTAFISLFGKTMPKKTPEGGLDIDTFESMSRFSADLKKKISMTSNNFTYTYQADGSPVTFQGRLVRNAVMELESVILIGKPGSVPAGA